MKKLLFSLTLTLALALGSQSALAQAKKKPATTAEEAAKAAAEAAKAAAPATPAKAAAPAVEAAKTAVPAKADKPLPFHTIVDSIDASGKSFAHKNKDGKEVKNVVTSKTELRSEDKDAKFEDIKVGEEVTGTRLKKSDTEYEVVKTTYIGAPKKKAEKPAAEPKKK